MTPPARPGYIPCPSIHVVNGNEMSWLDELKFDAQGLLPVVAQDASSGEVLMVAYANRDALERTAESGRAHYWSRSRAEIWRKGDTSGHIQEVREIRVDCDGDALVYRIRQEGAACHTGERSCFYRALDPASPGALVFRDARRLIAR